MPAPLGRMDASLRWFKGVSAEGGQGASAPGRSPAQVLSGSGYRRVLALIDLAGHGEAVIRRACACGLNGEGALLAVHVIDGRSLFDSDGPCGYFLAAERFGHRVPQAAQRLDLMLARNQAAWAESAVLVAGGAAALIEMVDRWRPDLIVADRHSATRPWAVAALRRARCKLVVVDDKRIPVSGPGRFLQLLKGETLMNARLAVAADKSRTSQVAKTVFLGVATLLLYLLLFANEATVLKLSGQGHWYFLLPILIAFVFSFFHGAFTAEFWDVLGVKASGKKG